MIFTTRRFASAVYTVRVVCLFVRLSVTSRYSIERVERIELVWTWRLFPPILYRVISKSRWKFVSNSGLWKFRHETTTCRPFVNRPRWRSSLLNILSARRVCLLDVRRLWSSNCIALHRFVVDLSYNLFLQLCSLQLTTSRWHGASRGPSALAELLVNSFCELWFIP